MRLFLSQFGYCVLALTAAFANPIVVDFSELQVVKSSQNLSISVFHEYSIIEGTFSYIQIPILDRELADASKDHFNIIVPIYVPKDLPEDEIQESAEFRLSIGDQVFEPTSIQPMVSSELGGPERIAEKGAKLYVIMVSIPIAQFSPDLQFELHYKQYHYKRGRKVFLIYTPIFENGKVWSGLKKDILDFLIRVVPAEGISLKEIEGPVMFYRDGIPHYIPEPGTPIRIEVQEQWANK